MRFHAAILQPNGQVYAKECRDSEIIAHHAVSHRVMDEFRQVLSENLTDDPTRCGKFQAQFGEGQLLVEWQQVQPFSAMARFYARGHIVAASFYLHGFVPELDHAAVEATEALFVNWWGAANASGACRSLRSIKERPVVVLVPASKEVLTPDDWHIIGNLCPCLAAVFFDRAEAAIRRIDTFWKNRGFRKGGTETDYLRN